MNTELSSEAKRLIDAARGFDDATADDRVRVQERLFTQLAAGAALSTTAGSAHAVGAHAVGADAMGAKAWAARTFAGASLVHVLTLVIVLETWGAWAAPLAICASTICWGSVFWMRVARETSAGTPLTLLREPALIALAAIGAGGAIFAVLPPVEAGQIDKTLDAEHVMPADRRTQASR